MKNIFILFIGFLFLLDILLLTFLGELYSKFVVFKPYFHIHDVLLLFVAIGSALLIKRDVNRIISIELLFGLAILYLLISIFTKASESSIYYVFRQFMVFGYGILVYSIIKSFYSLRQVEERITMGIALFGILCLLIQVMYIVYFIINYKALPFFERNYYSPMVIIGLLITSSYILTNVENGYLKHIYFLFVFVVSFSIGHDSMYLSLGIIYSAYLYLKANMKFKILIIGTLGLLLLALMIFIPSFTDVNMQWRMIYWKDSFLMLVDNYFIFGNGFGTPYVSIEAADKLNTLMTSNGHNVQILNEDKYLVAPHNSFLSMTIHLGIIPIILLIYPLLPLFKNKQLFDDMEIMFLFLCLLGIVVFSSFNVILELPHSSSIFWIVYFVLIFKLKKKSERVTV